MTDMRNKLLFTAAYFLIIILFLFVPEVLSDELSTCPTPTVKKRTIIRSKESIRNGARLIGKDIVDNAKDCYELCCNDATCNVAIMHYKEEPREQNSGNNEIVTYKYCFLFACGTPSVCTYEYHRRYAVIDLGSRDEESVPQTTTPKPEQFTTTTPPMTTTTTTTTTTPIIPTTTESTTAIHPGAVSTSSSANVHSTTKEPIQSVTNGKHRCGLPPVTGNCRAAFPRYYYDGATKTCKSFVYGGCQGNDNRFETEAKCMEACGAKDVCPLVCTYEYEPVCGDDDKTYDNKCLFKLAKCKSPSRYVAYDGQCRECPPGVPMPACSDDPCKITSCPSNKNAVCKANFCGGCNAVYYDSNGKKVDCSGTGACHAKLSSIPKGLIGAQVPQCKSDGTFEEKQCHGSTGYCWCVDSKTGTEIKGTKKGPTDGDVSCGACHIKLSTLPKGLIGAHTPQCKSDGTYEEKQCHGSTGYCWCVDPETGTEIKGTKKGPTDGEVTCGVGASKAHNEQSVTVSSTDYEEAPEETLLTSTPADDPYFHSEVRTWLNVTAIASCYAKLSTIRKGLVGTHTPQCKPDGSFKEKQCHGSTGYCWCVDSKTGTEIKGTKKGPTDGDVSCESANDQAPVVVVVKENNALSSFLSLPLLIALVICIVLLIGVIYRVKCIRRGRGKKLPVDDGDYLINGMYL